MRIGGSGILYVGRDESVSICLLGSRKHLLGSSTQSIDASASTSDMIEDLLSISEKGTSGAPGLISDPTSEDLRTELTLNLIEDAAHSTSGVARTMSFVARMMARWPGTKCGQIVLASPVFVAESG